ncbi:N-acetylglucosamine-6-phosphate deacetylase [Glaciecola sp. MH2013]|uniref:N-acetylglucosamine-6-phosphate deacetylase n=1 Tax=Glaciecola sp. MH2013 TaxID=2785524 RepID=UPI00189D3752|nr:N-acetylglucosamine-6-phosphate deacetylase [Glaciecola sp. MH2013]MBF7073441.1 N-acetylglucosamine-6-phosphate deacetylase [Glaciecola sp. MH2013]
MTSYFAPLFFDGHKLHQNIVFSVNSGTISSISDSVSDASEAHADKTIDGIVSPGFFDTQVNGGGGVLFNHDPSYAALIKIAKGHRQYGTRALLPTLITDNIVNMQAASNAVAEAISQGDTTIQGIHFEGPHLSNTKRGIHSAEHVRSISDKELALFTRKDCGKVLLTVAPENLPSDIIRDLSQQGIVISLGHSNADIDTVLAAIEAGARGFTHLFNAMSGLKAREPGMIAAALTHENIYAGLIADFHHVHPINCKLAAKALGKEGLMLVTDAMSTVGSDLQSLPWLNDTISKQGSRLSLADGSLAGSCLDMASAVKNMYQLLSQRARHDTLTNFDLLALEQVLTMATSTPAKFLGLEGIAKLHLGSQAEFIVLNNELECS